MTRCRAAMLAVVAGVAYGCAHVGIGVWPLSFGCLAIWWYALAKAGAVRGFATGLGFGAVAYATAMGWLLPTASRFAGAGDEHSVVGLALWLAQGAWIALGFGVAGATTTGLLRQGWPVALAGALPLVFVEWLQPQVFGAGPGAALATVPVLAQPAALGGPLLLTTFVAVTNGWLLDAFRASGRDRVRLLAGGTALVSIVAIGGTTRLAALDRASEAGPALNVGLVQANLDPLSSRIDAGPSHAAHLAASRALIADHEVDLLIWPEGAYARALPGTLPLDGQPVRADVDAPLLFGANRRTNDTAKRGARNAAFLIGPDGRIAQAYDKRRLVPLAESAVGDGLAAWRNRLMPHARSFLPGDETVALDLGPHRIATPICYEVTHARDVDALVNETGATVIVTLADDGWFGRSREPAMHLALARLRAIEQGRWLVRAAMNGPSAVVDPGGRVRAQTPAFEAASLTATIESRSEATPYARFGDGAVIGVWLVLGIGLAIRSRLARA